MSLRPQFDPRLFSREALKLSMLKGQAATQTLKEEGKLYVRDCQAMTPPIGPNPISESPKSQQARGEKTISKDFGILFLAARGLKVMTAARKKKVHDDLDKAIKYDRVAEVQAILEAIGIRFAKVEIQATAEAYAKARDKRTGRIRRGFRQIILRSQTIGRLKKLILKDVGKAKAGWTSPAKALGLRLPAWVEKHAGEVQSGLFVDKSEEKEKAFIEFGNLIAWAQQFEGRVGIMEAAGRLRILSMQKRIQILIKKGYGAK